MSPEERYATLTAILQEKNPKGAPVLLEHLGGRASVEERTQALEGYLQQAGFLPEPAPAKKVGLVTPPPAAQPETATATAKAEPRAAVPRAPAAGRKALPHVGSDDGYAAIPYRVIEDLLGRVPLSVFAGYIYCVKIADKEGSFWISHKTLAGKLGDSSERSSKRIMRTLLVMGLVERVLRGAKGRATRYRLAPVERYSKDRCLAAIVSTWIGKNPHRWEALRDSPDQGTAAVPDMEQDSD